MMNAARYAVGMQGIAIAERAYQQAVAYAKDRVQSRPVDGSINASAPIIHHPDVQAHADDDARLHRRLPRDGQRGRGCLRRGASSSRRRGAQAEPGLLRIHGAAGQGLQHRDERRSRPRWACRCTAAWASSRRPARRSTTATPDPHHLRRHDRDPGQRPGGPQDRARRRPDRQGHRRPDREDRSANWRSATAPPRGGAQAAGRRARGVRRGGGLRRRQHQGIAQRGVRRLACPT